MAGPGIYSKTSSWRLWVIQRLGGSLVTTTATSGFGYIPEVVGLPTGIPADLTQGIPVVIDSSGPTLYGYISGAWVSL